MYVTDGIRVLKLNAAGTFIKEWGAHGGPVDPFNYTFGPSTIDIDSAGNVYVWDGARRGIGSRNSMPTATSSSNGESVGSGDAEFAVCVTGMGIDSLDNIYVVDNGNDRIQKFDGEGTLLAKWGQQGTGNGRFEDPYGLAVDASDNIYVGDRGNSRIQQFSPAGAFIRKWGTPGTGSGQFSGLADLAAGPGGVLYSTEVGYMGHPGAEVQLHRRLSRRLGWTDRGRRSVRHPARYRHRRRRHRLPLRYEPRPNPALQRQRRVPRQVGKCRHGQWAVRHAHGHHGCPQWQRVRDRQRQLAGSGSSAPAAPSSENGAARAPVPASSRSATLQFKQPNGLATDSTGKVYVTDAHRVQKFNAEGSFLTEWGSYGLADGEFTGAAGIADRFARQRVRHVCGLPHGRPEVRPLRQLPRGVGGRGPERRPVRRANRNRDRRRRHRVRRRPREFPRPEVRKRWQLPRGLG